MSRKPAPTQHAATDDNTIVLRLQWWHPFQFAGFHAEQAKGYDQDEGLNVIIEEGVAGRSAQCIGENTVCRVITCRSA